MEFNGGDEFESSFAKKVTEEKDEIMKKTVDMLAEQMELARISYNGVAPVDAWSHLAPIIRRMDKVEIHIKSNTLDVVTAKKALHKTIRHAANFLRDYDILDEVDYYFPKQGTYSSSQPPYNGPINPKRSDVVLSVKTVVEWLGKVESASLAELKKGVIDSIEAVWSAVSALLRSDYLKSRGLKEY